MPANRKRRPTIKADRPPLLDAPTSDKLLVSEDIERALAALDEEEESPESSNIGRMLVGVFILVLSLMMIGLVIITSTIQDMNTPLRAEATRLAETLARAEPADQGEIEMRATLDVMRSEANNVSGLLATLQPGFFDWADVMRFLGDYDPNTLTLTGIAELNGGIVINGRAKDEETVMTYAESLRRAPQFSRVIIQSLTLRTLTVRTDPGSEPIQQQVTEFTLTIDIIRGIE